MLQKTYLRKLLAECVTEGWTIYAVDNGEERIVKAWTPTTATNEACETDDAWIMLKRGTETGTLAIVWQGPVSSYPQGEEVVNDYSLSLEGVVERFDAKVSAPLVHDRHFHV